MLDPGPLVVYAVSTGFALTVDVGAYAVVHFAAASRPRGAFRFAIEIAVAHAVFLVLGAFSAAALGRTLGSDFIVDAISAIALTIVLRGAYLRAGARPLLDVDAAETMSAPVAPNAFAWFTAFTLSLDALLIAPAASEFVDDAPAATKTLGLVLVTASILVLAWLYAAFSRRLRDLLLARTNGGHGHGRVLSIASAAELVVFSVFLCDALSRMLEHASFGQPSGELAVIGAGGALGVVLFAIARRRSNAFPGPNSDETAT